MYAAGMQMEWLFEAREMEVSASISIVIGVAGSDVATRNAGGTEHSPLLRLKSSGASCTPRTNRAMCLRRNNLMVLNIACYALLKCSKASLGCSITTNEMDLDPLYTRNGDLAVGHEKTWLL